MLEKAKGLNFVLGTKFWHPNVLKLLPGLSKNLRDSLENFRGRKKEGECKIVCLVATCSLCTLTLVSVKWVSVVVELCERKTKQKSRYSLRAKMFHKYIKVFHFYAIGTVAVCKQGECNSRPYFATKSGNGPRPAPFVFCKKTNVRFPNYTSAALADKSHLVLRVIGEIYKKSSEIKRAKFCFLPQP